MDFYGGWKATFGDFGLDIGGIYYYYPGRARPGTAYKIDNGELYIGGSWGPLALKYSYALTDFFGVPGTKGAYYVVLSGDARLRQRLRPQRLGRLPGRPEERRQRIHLLCHRVRRQRRRSITDYKLGGTYTIDGWVLGLAYVSTNRDIPATPLQTNPNRTSATAPRGVVTKSF